MDFTNVQIQKSKKSTKTYGQMYFLLHANSPKRMSICTLRRMNGEKDGTRRKEWEWAIRNENLVSVQFVVSFLCKFIVVFSFIHCFLLLSHYASLCFCFFCHFPIIRLCRLQSEYICVVCFAYEIQMFSYILYSFE